jgi:hypothetical protein
MMEGIYYFFDSLPGVFGYTQLFPKDMEFSPQRPHASITHIVFHFKRLPVHFTIEEKYYQAWAASPVVSHIVLS